MIGPGDRYGVFEVIEKRGSKWLCRCECGTLSEKLPQQLRRGKNSYCSSCPRPGKGKLQESYSREYDAWLKMKKTASYIPRWESFQGFLRDMGRRPRGASLRRKDNSAIFQASNAYWASESLKTRQIEIDGEEKSLTEWSKLMGIDKKTIWSRLKRGWSERDAIMRPTRKKSR